MLASSPGPFAPRQWHPRYFVLCTRQCPIVESASARFARSRSLAVQCSRTDGRILRVRPSCVSNDPTDGCDLYLTKPGTSLPYTSACPRADGQLEKEGFASVDGACKESADGEDCGRFCFVMPVIMILNSGTRRYAGIAHRGFQKPTRRGQNDPINGPQGTRQRSSLRRLADSDRAESLRAH